MASQTRAIKGDANSPWEYNAFSLDVAPLPALWTLDAIYQSDVVVLSGDYSEIDYFVKPLTVFSSIGSASVTSISLTLQNTKSDFITSVDYTFYIGTGDVTGYSIAWVGPTATLSLDTIPTNRTVTSNMGSPLARSFIKTNMTSANFFVGVGFSNPNVVDQTLDIDTISIQINYTDTAVPSSSFRDRGGPRGRILWGIR